MSRVMLALTLSGVLAASLASAQDASAAGKQIAQQYQQSMLPLGGKTTPRSNDPRLSAAFVDKLAACYTQETKAPLPEKSHTLLVEYAPELVLQFTAAFKGTACDLTKRASEGCLSQVNALPCEPFANVIRAQGCDRAPSPAMQAAIAKYTDRLAGRYVACRAGGEQDVEASSVRSDHLAKSAAVQISMLLSTGQCSLVDAQLQNCVAKIAAPDACSDLVEHAKQARLPRFCSDFLDCSQEPLLVGKIAK